VLFVISCGGEDPLDVQRRVMSVLTACLTMPYLSVKRDFGYTAERMYLVAVRSPMVRTLDDDRTGVIGWSDQR
jgi:hypothetical protein